MMDKENIYTEWKASRSQMDLPDGFAERVMAQVRKQAREKVVEPAPNTLEELMRKAVELLVGLGLSLLGVLRVAHLVGGLMLP